MRLKILFVDVDCPQPFTGESLDRMPLGGTEATLFRVAVGLAKSGFHEVFIAQHNREAEETTGAVSYIPFRFGEETGIKPDAVVVLRSFKILESLAAAYPDARLFLWMHCFPGSRWNKAAPALEKHSVTVVCVSKFLKDRMREVVGGKVRVTTIYNPVSAHALHRPHDLNKLVFFSSPHKGLPEVLERFSEIRKEFPLMKLHLADPGYWAGPVPEIPEGVICHGSLPSAELHAHVASALCVFYPQRSFAETFGLVFTEANALGTPVLAHPLGAAQEILEAGGAGQVIDCTPENVVRTIRAWRNGARPMVRAHSDFRLENILPAWSALLCGDQR